MNIITLYHTSFDIIEKPDITIGRKNADFGQGFYMSDNLEFSKRWARSHKDKTTYLNKYELDTDDLSIKIFDRDTDWFEYIYNNRRVNDLLINEYDVIIGPIANDTIYNTYGIISSGFLKKEEAVKLLMIGPLYKQIVIKSDKAVSKLIFIGYEVLDDELINSYRDKLKQEEEEYQKQFSDVMKTMM